MREKWALQTGRVYSELVQSVREILLGHFFLRTSSTHLESEKAILTKASFATWTVLDCENHVTWLMSGKAPFCTNNYPEQYNILFGDYTTKDNELQTASLYIKCYIIED